MLIDLSKDELVTLMEWYVHQDKRKYLSDTVKDSDLIEKLNEFLKRYWEEENGNKDNESKLDSISSNLDIVNEED